MQFRAFRNGYSTAHLVLFGLALMISACGSGRKTGSPQAPIDIWVAEVTADQTAGAIAATGKVAWREEIPMGFTSAGKIARVFVRAGDQVRRGQLLAVLDTTEVIAALAAAQAEQRRARAQLGRLQPLADKGWVSRVQLDAARAAAEAANARVSADRFAVETARIIAGSDGVILQRFADPGQIVAAGVPVLALGKAASGYVLQLPLTDRDLGRVQLGASATIRFDALGDAELAGTVSELGGKADPATATFQAEVALPADARLRSGMIGRVKIVASEKLDQTTTAVLPPLALFAARANEGFVFVLLPDNLVSPRKVKIVDIGDERIAISGEVQPGDWVAVSGIDRLRNGMRVMPHRRMQ